MPEHYQRPGWVTKHVFNPFVAALTRLGIGLRGARVLEVRGRKSGEWRATPVNPLELDGVVYIVAPRGHTQWVKNLRANPEGRLRFGRGVGAFTAVEVPDAEKVPVLREYLKRWKMEVGTFFEAGPDAPDEELARIATDHPVFRVQREQ